MILTGPLGRTVLTSRKNSLELIEVHNINKVGLFYFSSCSNTGSIKDDSYWTSRKNSLELIEVPNINKVNLVYVSSCSNTGSIRDILTCSLRKIELKN